MEENSLNIEIVKEQQIQDEDLQKWINKYPDQYFYTNIGDAEDVLCYCKPGKDE